MNIILDGVSSSGKTSIAKLFPKKYKYFSGDDFTRSKNDKIRIAFSKQLIKGNNYLTVDEFNTMYSKLIYKTMSTEIKKHTTTVIDVITPDIYKLLSKTRVILIYTTLDDLMRNLISRELTSPRGSFIFNQYAKKFVKANKDDKYIDIVSKPKFIKILQKTKYNFTSEDDLRSFAVDIFKQMSITDDKEHKIKIRNDVYDLVITTKDKTPKKLVNEIFNIIV
jgi:adenylate kinase family enzyme